MYNTCYWTSQCGYAERSLIFFTGIKNELTLLLRNEFSTGTDYRPAFTRVFVETLQPMQAKIKKLSAVLIIILLFTSCGSSSSDISGHHPGTGGNTSADDVTVTFHANGGTGVPSQTLENGDLITRPSDPARQNCILNGWYREKECTNPWDFDTDTVTSDTTLYAGWSFSGSSVNFTVNYEHGTNLSPTAYKNIYVIWIENSSSNFLQNLFICQKLISGGLTGTVLPFWKMNRYPSSDIDEVNAVTGATQANTDFAVTGTLKNSSIRKCTVYVEIDRSYETNDWFYVPGNRNVDQPALLYKAEIDLDNVADEYELSHCGWTPNSNTENIIPDTPAGTLQTETRYITNKNDGSGGFGDIDSRSATNMVKKITLTVN